MNEFNFKATALSELTPITTYIFDRIVQNDIEAINKFIGDISIQDSSARVLSTVARCVYKIGSSLSCYKIFLESVVIKLFDSNDTNDLREANKMFSLLRNFPTYDEDVAYGICEFVAVKKAKLLQN